MSKVVEFKLKDKRPNQVYEHGCGSQLWFIEELPGGKLPNGESYEGTTVLRCASCCKLAGNVDVELSDAEDEE